MSLLLTNTIAQAADPATICKTAKLKAVGKKADCLAKEQAKAQLGKPSKPAMCVNAFIRDFAKAEVAAVLAGGACPVTGDVAVIEDLVDTCIENIAVTIAGSCAHSQFPASGQTVAYPADKNDGIGGAVAVPDDGAVQAGATLSYTDNGDGTITDNNTGLMWEKKDDAGGLHDKDNAYYWSGDGSQETIWDWLEDINVEGGPGYAGHSDWRIPNRLELESIADAGRHDPSLDPIFGLIGEYYYWSSTSSAYNPSIAWVVNFFGGDVFPYDKSNSPRFVRAVRDGSGAPPPPCAFPASGQTTAYTADKNDGIGGAVAVPDDGAVQAGATLSYTDNGDGTITDNNTGLIWEKKMSLDSTQNFASLHDADNVYYWSGDGSQETIWDWLGDINMEGGTGYAGHSDWRIPNRLELESIADAGRHDPSLDPIFGPTVNSSYWSSTSSAYNPSIVWVVNFFDGYTLPYDKSNGLRYVRAVRGGS